MGDFIILFLFFGLVYVVEVILRKVLIFRIYSVLKIGFNISGENVCKKLRRFYSKMYKKYL